MAISIVHRNAKHAENLTNQRLTGANPTCYANLKGAFHCYNFTITESIFTTLL